MCGSLRLVSVACNVVEIDKSSLYILFLASLVNLVNKPDSKGLLHLLQHGTLQVIQDEAQRMHRCVCLWYLFPFANCPAYNVRRIEKVEPFPIVVVVLAQLL